MIRGVDVEAGAQHEPGAGMGEPLPEQGTFLARLPDTAAGAGAEEAADLDAHAAVGSEGLPQRATAVEPPSTAETLVRSHHLGGM